MSEAISEPVTATGGLGTFERYLSIWVALSMADGIAVGKLLPGTSSTRPSFSPPRPAPHALLVPVARAE